MTATKSKLLTSAFATLAFALFVALAAGLAIAPQAHAADAWEPADFTYGEWDFTGKGSMLYPIGDQSDKLEATLWVVTGFSESGKAKFAENQDLVIPAADPDGKKVQGVGDSAFGGRDLQSVYGVTVKSVTFPQDVLVTNEKNDPEAHPAWKSTSDKRGDFFIAASAFSGNQITKLDLPEGVIFIGNNAFNGNPLTQVSLPSTIMSIYNGAFARSTDKSLEYVIFPERTTFPLQVDNMAFAMNSIKAVQLPLNTDKVTKWAFFQNTGMEPVTKGTAAEKAGGIVHMYVTNKDELGTHIDCVSQETSNVQDLKVGTSPIVPPEPEPEPEPDPSWADTAMFTYDEAGTTVTGLTDAGKALLKTAPDMSIPDLGPTGESVIAIGPGVLGSTGADQIGTFGFKEDGAVYVPTSVKLPAGLQTIGENAFSAYVDTTTRQNMGVTSVTFPDGLKEIGKLAFQNAPLGAVVLPDSVTTLGDAAFTGHDKNATKIQSLTLSKGLTSIPSNAFNSQAIQSVDIPEGITSIGQRAFAGNHVKDLALPNTLETIGQYAFWNHQLSQLAIPGSVKTIEKYAFRVNQENIARSLAQLDLAEGIETIGEYAFQGSGLSEVEIPASLVALPANVFDQNLVDGDDYRAVVTPANLDQAKQAGAYAQVVANGTGHVIQLDLANAIFDSIPDQEHTGEAIEPAVVLTWADGTVLEAGVDYQLAYSNNVDAGTATVKATGLAPFANETSTTFAITSGDEPEPEPEPEPETIFIVEFTDGRGNSLDLQQVEQGQAAVAPADPTREGYTFKGWDKDFSNVTADLTVNAEWVKVEPEEPQPSSDEPVDPQPQPSSEEPVDPQPQPQPSSDDPVDPQPKPQPSSDEPKPQPSSDEPQPAPSPGPVSPIDPDKIWMRLAGDTAFGTMQNIAREGWKSSDTVVVATFDGFWDALAASSLAGKSSAPVLLTKAGALSPACADEIVRLGASRAIIVGGASAISEVCADQIRATLTGDRIIERYWGADAQGTAIDIANQVAANSDTCVVATSGGYWDALAASSYAYAKGAPIYLTNAAGVLKPETLKAIKAGGFSRAVIAGGPAAVDSRTEADLAGIGIGDVQRKWGADAVQTSVDFAKFAIEEGLSADFMGVATNGGYWDALTGGPLCGINNGVLVLASNTDTSAVSLPTANKGSISRAFVFGGDAALSDAVYAAFDASTR